MGPAGTDSLLVVVGGVKVKPGTARSLVVPATQTPEHWMRLSNLDRVVNPTFSSAILFFDDLLIRKNRTFNEVVEGLKESLGRVLVDFYPFAGRLELREDGLVDLHCNDQGAVFIEASLDVGLGDVGGDLQPMPALSGLEMAKLGPGPRFIPDQLTPMPTLVIQVTQFRKCGSVALAVNWHHTVADGSSGCHFMQSWAEVAMGKDLSVRPRHNRELLRPRTPLNPSLVNGYSTKNVKELIPRAAPRTPLNPSLINGYSTKNVEESLSRAAPKTPLNPSLVNSDSSKNVDEFIPRAAVEVTTEATILKSFPLTKQAVQGLKTLAKTEDCGYTSAEAISGYLWQLMTRARIENEDEVSSRHRESQTTRFFMFVDGRKRMVLPAGYFGNVVCSACAVSSEEDILKKPLSYAAGLIRKSIRSITGDYFSSLIDWVEEQRHAPPKSDHVNSLGHDTAATFWNFFPLYDMDFGWGKPSFATRNAGPRPLIDGIAIMPSREGPGHMVALLNLHADRMRRLQRDPEFSAIFSCNVEA